MTPIGGQSGKEIIGWCFDRVISSVRRAVNIWWWIVSKYTVLFLHSVRFYFGFYHGVRIVIDIIGLLAVHLIGRVGLLRPSKLLLRLAIGGRKGRLKVKLHRKLQRAGTYQEWCLASQELDEVANQHGWCEKTDGPGDDHLCDFKALGTHLERLRTARRNQHWSEIAFLLRVCCNRNFCQIRNPALYAHSFVHTKRIVEEFYAEVCQSLDALCEATLSEEQRRDNRLNEEVPGGTAEERDLHVTSPTSQSTSQIDDSESYGFGDTVPLNMGELYDLLSSLRLSMGRTALCLSGGGGLAISHLGVIKILMEMRMMPRVVSGSSGGALIAGLLAVATDEEFQDKFLRTDFLEARGVQLCPSFWQQLKNFFKTGYLLNSVEFVRLTRTLFGDETFADAFARTGRFVSITTTPASRGASAEPLVCNCINTPDVLIWSAAVASCSLPLVLPPCFLYARPRHRSPPSLGLPSGSRRLPGRRLTGSPPNRACGPGSSRRNSLRSSGDLLADSDRGFASEGVWGSRSPLPSCESGPELECKLAHYAPESMRFVDGSILQDIPHTELQTLFNVKSFVVSQVNPHFSPFISGPASHRKETRLLFMILDNLWSYLALDLRNRYARLLVLSLVPSIRGQDVSPFLMQSAEGHVTIVPASPSDFWRLTANPAAIDVARGLRVGERKTWPFINRLRHVLVLETKLRDLWLKTAEFHGRAFPNPPRPLESRAMYREWFPNEEQGAGQSPYQSST